ncbi:Hypothetical protein LUCI_4492 [Lucifera butyrica]|uniref:Uncharacterized protein n=1 Tax=Lucifera butyrica TaxID=1351585 RepID=A0A498RDY9_9FIRM|nr:hypothetical protein [Lucifera butyrica]VBB09205.1 Hypothetical protein LUCI_4492 [Lucifera butyrica]
MDHDLNRVNRNSQPVSVTDNKPIGVRVAEREGVFVNGFICQHCGLHFNLFSWKANRHRSDNTYCPECGKKGSFIHYRKALSSKQTRDENSKDEIFRHVPWPGSQLMNDSIIFSQHDE